MCRGFIILAILLLLAGLVGCSPPESRPQAKQGLLDLSARSWNTDKVVALNGEWNFYWKQFIPPQSFQSSPPAPDAFLQVPNTWPQDLSDNTLPTGTGYATYRLKIQLPADSIPLSLRVNTISTAMRIWVNGKSVYEVGKVATSASGAAPGFKPQVVPIAFAPTLDIVVHLSNHHYRKGGMWDTLQLGPHRAVARHWIRDYVITFFLIGSFIIMALYHIILYLYRRSDKSPLYFSIFCLLIVVRTLSTELYVIGQFLPWPGVIRAELLSFYLCVPIFAAFTRAIYPQAISGAFVRVTTIVTGIFCTIVLLLPPLWSSNTAIPFEIFAIGASLYGLYKVVKAPWHQLNGIIIFLLGLSCLLVTLVNDSLYANNIIYTFFAAPVGLFFFLFSQSALLSRRFSQMANVLEETNSQLEQKNQVIEEANEELSRLNHEMDVFVYRTSHDLRAPLTSLLGIIDLMRGESPSPENKAYLDLQERSIYKLDSFVREILDYSRNTQLALMPQFVDFSLLIDETYALYTHLPQYEKIDKRTKVSALTTFMGDNKRLEVVFNNLISNALRYYNPYEERSYIEISVDIDKKQALIQVQDNGLGIAPEHIDRIFDMFYRASNHQDSSGLGLFLVKETIAKMQGTIRVESTVNKGTTFTINLPNHLAKTKEVLAESVT